jgi:methionine sulfoxide reductase heme-binding subunit
MQALLSSLITSSRRRRFSTLTSASMIVTAVLYWAWGFSTETWVDISQPKAESWQWRLSMALAYTTLMAFALTLTAGPLAVLRGKPSPPHQALRRDMGLWTAALALAHISVSVFIHTDGWALWGLFLWHKPASHNWLPLRLDAFGQANFAGFALAGLLIFLVGLSNNGALRRLGLRRWKTLQRLSYLAFGLAALHGLLYQGVEQRDAFIRVVFIAIILGVVVLQVLGAASRTMRQIEKNRHKSGVQL